MACCRFGAKALSNEQDYESLLEQLGGMSVILESQYNNFDLKMAF